MARATAAWDEERAALETVLAGERTTKGALEARLEEVHEDRTMLENRLGSALEQVDQKDKEVLEAALMVKTTMERQMVAERDLKLRTEQVYELRARLSAAPSPPGTLPPPPSQS